MPTDRHEALFLILGHLKEHGYMEAFKSLAWEAGVDVNTEELAPHVSLMRILLDWKRAFEARYQGTPRILQACPKQEMMTLAQLPQPVMINSVQLDNVHGGQQRQGASTYQLPPQQQLVRADGSALAGGPVQTIQYVTNAGSQQLFHQPVHILGQAGSFVLAPSQQQQQQQQQQQVVDTADVANNALRQPGQQRGHYQQDNGGAGPMMGHGFNTRGAGTVASHSTSLHSRNEQDGDGSRGGSQQDMHALGDSDEVGASRGRAPALANLLASNAKRTSNSGSAAPITKLKGGSQPITQDTFLAVINQVGEGAVASQLFDFRRPQRAGSNSVRRSAILQLEEDQHDAMYALAGCEDVNFLISNVQSEVRTAMAKVFGIEKESFTVWFKNRGRNPSKMQGHYQSSGLSRSAPKRGRMSDAGYD